MYTTCMFCGFPPFNIFALIYQKKKELIDFGLICVIMRLFEGSLFLHYFLLQGQKMHELLMFRRLWEVGIGILAFQGTSMIGSWLLWNLFFNKFRWWY